MLWHIKEGGMDAVSVPADRVVALTNGGGIREDIKAGDVTRKDVNAVLPFGNTVAVVYVTGAELLEALEASTIYFPMGGFPQVAGIQYTIDDAKTFDQGEQYPDSTYYGPKSIQRVTINSINGRDFDPKATYAVITNDFLASGGDTYFAFKNASAQFDTSIEMDIVVMDYITTELKGTITAEKYGEVDGRITIKEDPIKVYTDVDVTEWYAPALRYVVTAGSMTGTGAATFAPKATITRAEVMKLIANMAGADTKPAEGEQWYDKAVAWAVENKISDGKDATSVSSREDFVIMLYNYIKMQGKGLASDWSFSLKNPDADQLSENATEAMQWMVENGVIKGVDDAGTLAPKSSATRAEMAQILLNMSKVAA